MVEAIEIQAALAPLTMLKGRTPTTPGEETAKAFATLAAFREGAIFAGSFQGTSDWERHRQGDELVQILAGATRLTIATAEGPQVLALTAGMLTVVPQDCWHRFEAPEGVTVLTATPQPTDHAAGAEPPAG